MDIRYNKYIYDGPVKEFDDIVSNHWHGETVATSEKKAKSNLIYQFKKHSGRIAATKISLPGTIKKID